MARKDNLLKQAKKCPNPECNDQGYSVIAVPVEECCRMPLEDGSCCGNAVQGFEPEMEQCEFCYTTIQSLFNIKRLIRQLNI